MRNPTNIQKNAIWYFVLTPFLFPVGFSEYFSGYKIFSAFILGIAVFIILSQAIINIFYSRGIINLTIPVICILIYHATLLTITMLKQGSINQGFQKIFVVPAICLLLAEYGRKNFRNIIDAGCNILISEFLLGIFVFNQWLFPSYFNPDNLIIFVGHVQKASEIGILALFFAYCEYKCHSHNIKAILLCLLSILTMLSAKTSAAYLAIAVIFIMGILGNIIQVKKFVINHIKLLVIIFIVLSIMWINIYNIPIFHRYLSTIILYTSGRTDIWERGLALFEESPVLGYGAYGVMIKPFWTAWSANKLGFNYAHNTILQLLLDGGIVLAAIFIITLYSFVYSSEKYISDASTKYMAYVFLISYLAVGQFESITEHYYFFIFLSLIPYVDESLRYEESPGESYDL